MSVTSDELNLVIHQYLVENGFNHSAWVFANESYIAKTPVARAQIPSGALVNFVQKGLRYTEIETEIAMANQDAMLLSTSSSAASAIMLSNHLDDPLFRKRRREITDVGTSGNVNSNNNNNSNNTASGNNSDNHGSSSSNNNNNNNNGPSKKENLDDFDIVLLGHDAEVYVCAWNPTKELIASGSGDSTARIWSLATGADGGVNGSSSSSFSSSSFPSSSSSSQPFILKHSPATADTRVDITSMSWNHLGSHLATACYDGQVRIWDTKGELVNVLLGHTGPIFAVRWSPDSSQLLSCSMDKTVIRWKDAEKASVFSAETHIASLAAQNQVGIDSLLTTPIAILEGRKNLMMQYHHSSHVLDVAWRDNYSFASGTSDRTVNLYAITSNNDSSSPIAELLSHQDEVNAVAFAPNRNLLASCSDDCTAKLWDVSSVYSALESSSSSSPPPPTTSSTSSSNGSMDVVVDSISLTDSNNHDKDETNKFDSAESKLNKNAAYTEKCLKLTLEEHSKVVYTTMFSPTGEGSNNPNLPLCLGTSSFDCTVKLWDVETGKSLHTLRKHAEPVYTISFSPNGEFIASGSFDETVRVWNVRSGDLVKTLRTGGSGIYEVSWSPNGDKIAACGNDGSVRIRDMRSDKNVAE